jgi:hypothetical protein
MKRKLEHEWKIEEKLRKKNEGEIPTMSKVENGIKIYT